MFFFEGATKFDFPGSSRLKFGSVLHVLVWCVARSQGWKILHVLPPLCPCVLSLRTLVSSLRPYGEVESGTVSNDENLRPSSLATAGLLLVNHQREHSRRQISACERSSEAASYGPRHVVSGMKWAELTRQGSNAPWLTPFSVTE